MHCTCYEKNEVFIWIYIQTKPSVQFKFSLLYLDLKSMEKFVTRSVYQLLRPHPASGSINTVTQTYLCMLALSLLCFTGCYHSYVLV